MVLVAFLVVILLILISRSSSPYSSPQINTGEVIIPSLIRNDTPIMQNLYDVTIKSIKGEPVLQSVNNIITRASTIGHIAPLVPYASEEAVANMFASAWSNGESGLTNTDKFLLRLYASTGFSVAAGFAGVNGFPTLEYDSQGKPIWTDATLAPLGLSVNQGIQKVFELAKKYAPGTNATADELVVEINKILPSTYTKFSSGDDYQSRNRNSNGPIDPGMIWFAKFVAIGPLYILWVAENKWRLDLTWQVPTSPASSP